MTGSQGWPRSLFSLARSLSTPEDEKKKKQDALTTSSPPLFRPLPPVPQVSLTRLCHYGVLQDRLPVSIREFVGLKQGVSARVFFSLLSLSQMHAAALAETRFFSVACSAVFLETRDTSAEVAPSLVFALALHEKPSFVTSASSSAGRWEQLEGMTRRTRGGANWSE